MKKSIFKFLIPVSLVILTVTYSCKKYLQKGLNNQLGNTVLASKAGVDGLLIGAYAMLDMNSGNVGGSTWGAAVSNWHFGGIASDDADKGSNPTDQPPAAEIMNHSVTPSNEYVGEKWKVVYTGVQRANDVIRELPLVKDGSVSADYAKEVTAEAKFLRAVYHLEGAKIWRNIPYVDETISYQAGNYNVGNPGPIWDKIEADFKAAVADLPATQAQVGRANKYAAEAFLARAYMFDHKYAEANAALKDVIANGVTTQGKHFALNANFDDNFNASLENGVEAVFAVQMSVNDQSNGNNGNPGDVLNFPAAGPATCCGFYQPSFSLVDSYKTDAVTGLPSSYDEAVYDATFLKSDQNVAANDATYLPDTTTPVDPRLDWTAGRRGIPFLDYGTMPGASWARAQADAGPYINIKNVYRKAATSSTSDSFGGWATGQSDAINFNMIRFADVLLMAAECEVEVGSQAQAEIYVNMVRARAQTGRQVMGRLTGYTGGDASKPIVDNSLTAANYVVKPYTGQITGGSKDFARKAVWFERKLEFAMEGLRFFDLQRYDGLYGGPGGSNYMANTLNQYIVKMTGVPPFDAHHLSTFFPNSVLNNNGTIAKFTAGRNEIYPIPNDQISLEKGALKQNPGGY